MILASFLSIQASYVFFSLRHWLSPLAPASTSASLDFTDFSDRQVKNAAEGFTQSFVVLGKKSAKLVSGIADVDIVTNRNDSRWFGAFLIWNVRLCIICGETEHYQHQTFHAYVRQHACMRTGKSKNTVKRKDREKSETTKNIKKNNTVLWKPLRTGRLSVTPPPVFSESCSPLSSMAESPFALNSIVSAVLYFFIVFYRGLLQMMFSLRVC